MVTEPDGEETLPHVAFAAFHTPAYRRYWSGNFLALLGAQMQFVAVGWDIYDRTGESLQLGLVGLVQIIPVILLALPAGHVVDRTDRRQVIVGALTVMIGCSIALACISSREADYRWIYVFLFINGIARAFIQPAKSALLPTIVSRACFANAVTWSTAGFQLATVVGPACGGFSIAWSGSATATYLASAALSLVFIVGLSRMALPPRVIRSEPVNLRSLMAGLSFVWRTKLLLGVMSLDMFAVLLGGATALLPIYAKDILHTGPDGLGWLRAAPGLGALVTSYVLTRRPPLARAGIALLWSVTGFGAATIVFGFSRSLGLALAMLFLTGAFDTVSVVVRHTIVQLWTPDAMRGRVSAVNGMFIGISNELGEFESGTVAHFFGVPGSPAFGPTVSVVSGGIGTIVVVLLTAWVFPEVRRHGRLDAIPSPAPVQPPATS
jgi:MFS family permease